MKLFGTQIDVHAYQALYRIVGNEDSFYGTSPFSFSTCASLSAAFDCNDMAVTQNSAFALNHVDNSTPYTFPIVILDPLRKNHSTVGDSCVSGGISSSGGSCTTGSGVLGVIQQLQQQLQATQ